MNAALGPAKPDSEGRPLISVVIPVFNVADYLPECLDSITQQDFGDIEIIAVDGASWDNSREILERRRQDDPRLTVLHRDEIGPGRARNLGASQARGKYLWFVDGDDIIPPGSLSLIANRVQEVRPDVLLIKHEEFFPNRRGKPGRRQPGHGHERMRSDLPASFTLAEQPWVIELSMASWNKVVRTEFFTATRAEFRAEAPHEDVLVSCLLLLGARKLSVLDATCYNYRRDRAGSAMLSGRRRRHFKIFDSYAAVLDQVEKRAANSDIGITDEVRRAFFTRAIRHYCTIFDTTGPGIGPIGMGGLVARRDRRDFFQHMHQDFAEFRPYGWEHPSGLHGLRSMLIERDDYWAYELLESANWLRVRMTRLARELHGRRAVDPSCQAQTPRADTPASAAVPTIDRTPAQTDKSRAVPFHPML